MKNNLVIPTAIFVLVGILSLLSKSFDWYDDYWFMDIMLHTISGVGFGFLWIALEKKPELWVVLLGCMSFAVFGSVLWEFGEFAAWKIVPAYGPFYSPRLPDTLGDIFCGLVGGILSFLIPLLRYPKENA